MTRVAAAQFAPTIDEAENLRTIEGFAGRAAEGAASLLVLPEYSSWFSTDFSAGLDEAAQPLDGTFVTRLREVAVERGLVIVAGFVEAATETDPRVANAVVAVGPGGDLLAVYRKIHLYDAFGTRESDWMRPGAIEAPQTFDIEGLRFGLQTCYDIRFPEVSRRLMDAGADVIVVPAEWVAGPDKRDHWVTLCRARAIENTAFLLAADHVAPVGVGASLVVDPLGHMLADAGDDEGIVFADLDPDVIGAVRGRNPALALRRFDVRPA